MPTFAEEKSPMRKVTVCLFAVAVLLCACHEEQPREYVNDVLNRMTPVKNQGKSQTCWIYAMLAALETEHIMRGDSVNLSAAYVEKMLEKEPSAPESKRGMGQTLINMIQKHGLVAYDAMRTTDTPPPMHAYMLGAEYTPLEFAHSVCAPDEYIALTTDRSKPYYQWVEVDVPDNWDHSRFYNVPADTIVEKMALAVKNGRGVCWESKAHAMAVVGLAHDKQGHRYFVMKNSWGDEGPYHGLCYVSFAQARKETLAVCLPYDAF